MRKFVGAALCVLLMVLCMAAVASAHPPRHVRVVSTGQSGGKLLGQWWAQVLALPANPHPKPLCLRLDGGKVLAPVQTRPKQTIHCKMRVGGSVLVVGDSAECSTNESPPFHGDTAVEQRACAIRELNEDKVTSLTGSVDGAPAIEFHRHRYEVVSPQTHAVFTAAGGQFPVTAGPGTFVGADHQALVRGLGVGHHTLSGKEVDNHGTDHVTFKVNVTH